MGVRLPRPERRAADSISPGIVADDVVILPGVRRDDRTTSSGCARSAACWWTPPAARCSTSGSGWRATRGDGFTAIIHGKHYHEETKATASQVDEVSRAAGTSWCSTWTRRGSSATSSSAAATRPRSTPRFAKASLPGFDFAQRPRAGRASPTRRRCCPASRSRSRRRCGAASSGATAPTAWPTHFRSFDTICSATQERQDAVLALLDEPLDVMVVVGGYNSSNTCHLAALVQSRGIRTFHIEDADCVDPATGAIRHQPIGTKREESTERLARRRPDRSASPPAPRRRTTRSARRSRGSASSPASASELRALTG